MFASTIFRAARTTSTRLALRASIPRTAAIPATNKDEAEKAGSPPAPRLDRSFEKKIGYKNNNGERTARRAPEPEKQVYIGNLPEGITVEDLRYEFGDFGVMTRVSMPSGAPFAFLQFEKAEDAKAVLAAHAHEPFRLGGLATRIRAVSDKPAGKDVNAPRPDRECQVRARGLPFNADEEAIKKVFSRFGTVDTVTIVRYEDTGRPRAWFVQFSNPSEARAALEAEDFVVEGRSVHCQMRGPGERGEWVGRQ
ncbi:hypothetical protein CYLTODRAFT_17245 [Cylindrobasidium torrendii FP15055 ss-10]|uniref:RRM domain-containing protein n=1 Tax=Cylindrobasidium torrendii FP15055 ss-10 TaxID=1314674 RepID=A0A0D7BA13_9AGAR|nr:hypothetical protein CYLTODRAFT_17245 [Cylindrobasidium torrendii FP15055 ss-10]